MPGIRGGEGNLLQHFREAELLIMKMKIEGEQQNRNGLQGPANIWPQKSIQVEVIDLLEYVTWHGFRVGIAHILWLSCFCVNLATDVPQSCYVVIRGVLSGSYYDWALSHSSYYESLITCHLSPA